MLCVTHKTQNTEKKPPPRGDPMTLDNMKPERGMWNTGSTRLHGGCPGDQWASSAVLPSLFHLLYIPLTAEPGQGIMQQLVSLVVGCVKEQKPDLTDWERMTGSVMLKCGHWVSTDSRSSCFDSLALGCCKMSWHPPCCGKKKKKTCRMFHNLFARTSICRVR